MAPSPSALPRVSLASNQQFLVGDKLVEVDHGALTDISIAPELTPERAVSAFGANPMKRDAVISVKDGARCNCYSYANWAPHLHGTHLETREHLRLDPTPAVNHLRGMAFVARLVTVDPVIARGLNLSLVPSEEDRVITREQVEEALAADTVGSEVTIIRSPNFPGKSTRKYGGTNPPYPHHEVAQLLVDRGVDHVVLDFPSADREEGELVFHRTFWKDPFQERTGQIIPELQHLENQPRQHATITEFAHIPDSAQDGWYLIYLSPIGLPGDAAPIRPMIAPMRNFP